MSRKNNIQSLVEALRNDNRFTYLSEEVHYTDEETEVRKMTLSIMQNPPFDGGGMWDVYGEFQGEELDTLIIAVIPFGSTLHVEDWFECGSVQSIEELSDMLYSWVVMTTFVYRFIMEVGSRGGKTVSFDEWGVRFVMDGAECRLALVSFRTVNGDFTVEGYVEKNGEVVFDFDDLVLDVDGLTVENCVELLNKLN